MNNNFVKTEGCQMTFYGHLAALSTLIRWKQPSSIKGLYYMFVLSVRTSSPPTRVSAKLLYITVTTAQSCSAWPQPIFPRRRRGRQTLLQSRWKPPKAGGRKKGRKPKLRIRVRTPSDAVRACTRIQAHADHTHARTYTLTSTRMSAEACALLYQ